LREKEEQSSPKKETKEKEKENKIKQNTTYKEMAAT
jgi:hypothetical protein